MPEQEYHYSKDLLKDYLNGILSLDAEEKISQHLNSCIICENALSELIFEMDDKDIDRIYFENFIDDNFQPKEARQELLNESEENAFQAFNLMLKKKRLEEQLKKKRKNRNIWLIAASFFLLALLNLFIYNLNSTSKFEKLLASYVEYIPIENRPSITLGSNDKLRYEKIFEEFGKQNYQEVIYLSNQIVPDSLIFRKDTVNFSINDQRLIFLKGLCYFLSPPYDYPNAIIYLEWIFRNANNDFSKPSRWVLSLLYYKAGNEIQAKKIWEVIAQESQYKSSEAQLLLKNLRK